MEKTLMSEEDILKEAKWSPLVRREFLKRVSFAGAGAVIVPLLHAAPPRAATLEMNARTIFERAVTSNITLSPDGSALQLKSGEVFQDDGPASGFSYKLNTEKLSPGIEIRKQLLIPDPRASKAVLMVGSGGDLKVEVNGKPQQLGSPQEIFYGQWQAYTIDPAALRPGVNDIVIGGTGEVRIARADDSYVELPHRSARSVDGGKSWTVDRLGPAGDIAGEYYVRVYLEHFLPSGSILLPVMDVANLEGNPLAPPLTSPGPLRVSVSTAPNSPGGVTLRVRSGTAYVPGPGTWSDWMPLDSTGSLEAPRGRFVQVEVTLSTADPAVTPLLREITLTTAPELANDWTKALKLTDFHNEEIVRTSIPFRYEPFTQPKLKELRARYRLDDVVNGAKTDLDIISRLAAWSVRQWKWADWHLDEFYPAWDALEILKKGPDGKPVGGFCQQYDVVFLQACESFGFVGREISISAGTLGRPTLTGHEPVEIWSNQFRKWIWIDGTSAYYAEDIATGVPLSLWEVRQRQLRVLSRPEGGAHSYCEYRGHRSTHGAGWMLTCRSRNCGSSQGAISWSKSGPCRSTMAKGGGHGTDTRFGPMPTCPPKCSIRTSSRGTAISNGRSTRPTLLSSQPRRRANFWSTWTPRLRVSKRSWLKSMAARSPPLPQSSPGSCTPDATA